ncbi:MAG: hypothetical protein JSR47_09220 [Proteobacteria bacterium]|nr:hypothetical protein [Pseudomonadota bacterium]MBS0549069.1 hypothetical protein [Pseudomonadota bacterium]
MPRWLAIVIVVTTLCAVGAALGVRFVGTEISKPVDDPPAQPLKPRVFGNGPIQT